MGDEEREPTERESAPAPSRSDATTGRPFGMERVVPDPERFERRMPVRPDPKDEE